MLVERRRAASCASRAASAWSCRRPSAAGSSACSRWDRLPLLDLRRRRVVDGLRPRVPAARRHRPRVLTARRRPPGTCRGGRCPSDMTPRIAAVHCCSPRRSLACATRDDDYLLLRRTRTTAPPASRRAPGAGGGQRRRGVLPPPPAGRRLRRRADADVRDEQALRGPHATATTETPTRSGAGRAGRRRTAIAGRDGRDRLVARDDRRRRAAHLDRRQPDARDAARWPTWCALARRDHRRRRARDRAHRRRGAARRLRRRSCRWWRRSGGRRAPSTTATSCAGCAASRDVRGNDAVLTTSRRMATRRPRAARWPDDPRSVGRDRALPAGVVRAGPADGRPRRRTGRSWRRRRRATSTPPCCWARSATSRPSCSRPGPAPRRANRPPRDLVDLVEAYADAYPAERAEATRIFLVTTYGATALRDAASAPTRRPSGWSRSWRC